MLTLYHSQQSRSIRPRWLLEEMGVPYQLERPEFRLGGTGGEAYRALYPLQKLPLLKDGDLVMSESTAMLEYIAARYGPTPLAATPQDEDYGPFLQWLHFGEATTAPAVNMLIGHALLLPEKHRSPTLLAWADKELAKQFAFIAQGLGEKDYLLARGFSAADISVAYPIFLTKLLKRFDAVPPTIKAYWERLSSRPAWRTATAD